VETYFDRRQGRTKPLPDCAKHGLVWDPETQRCERKGLLDRLLGDVMAEDFYLNDWGGGDFYNGGNGVEVLANGGGADWGFDTTSWPTLDEYYGGGGQPIDYAPGFDPSTGLWDTGEGYLLDPMTGDFYGLPVPDSFGSGESGDNLWGQIYENWLGVGADPDTAAAYADADLQAIRESQGVISIPSTEAGMQPTQLPTLASYTPISYFTPWIPFEAPFEDQIFFELPPPPEPPPTKTAPKLPPYCPGGTYHPYPIGHPQQDVCVPFPPAPKPPAGTQPKSPTQTPSPAPKPTAQQPKPAQTQQGCPPGYCKHPQTGQWIQTPYGYYCDPQTQICRPRCTTQGTVYDQAKGQCVPVAQATSPLPGSEAPGTELPDMPPEVSSAWDELKKMPLWVWAAAAGLLVFGMSGDGGTTGRRRSR
jgi:hypothetical protein